VVLPVLLRDDRAARDPHGGRHRRADVPVRAGLPGHDRAGEVRGDRGDQPVLALRGHRLDVPAAAVIPGGAAHPPVGRLTTRTRGRPMHEADDQPPVTTYYTTFAVIAALMVVTVLVSFSGMQQPWRVLLNLAIAGTQVGLLSWFFMHLRRSDRLTWVVA